MIMPGFCHSGTLRHISSNIKRTISINNYHNTVEAYLFIIKEKRMEETGQHFDFLWKRTYAYPSNSGLHWWILDIFSENTILNSQTILNEKAIRSVSELLNSFRYCESRIESDIWKKPRAPQQLCISKA